MSAALAWVCADAVLLVRTATALRGDGNAGLTSRTVVLREGRGHSRFVAFAVTGTAVPHARRPGRLRTVWRAGMRLWVASLILTVGWVALYLAIVNQKRWTGDLR